MSERSVAQHATEANSAGQAKERAVRTIRGANGPVLYASISYYFCPLCNGLKEKPAEQANE